MPYAIALEAIRKGSYENLTRIVNNPDFDLNELVNLHHDVNTETTTRDSWGTIDHKKGLIHEIIDKGDPNLLSIFLRAKVKPNVNLITTYNQKIHVTETDFMGRFGSTSEDNLQYEKTPVEYAFYKDKIPMAMTLIRAGGQFNLQNIRHLDAGEVKTLLDLLNNQELEKLQTDILNGISRVFQPAPLAASSHSRPTPGRG